MHKKFEINRTKINGVCQSGRKVVPHNSKSDLPLIHSCFFKFLESEITIISHCDQFGIGGQDLSSVRGLHVSTVNPIL